MLAGDEKSISNKTYLNTLAVLHLMAGGATGDLLRVADAMRTGLDEAAVVRAAEHLMPGGSIHFVGRGPALCSANQLALTFMEGGAVPWPGVQPVVRFRHGPYEVLGREHRGVVLAPAGRTHELCIVDGRGNGRCGAAMWCW